MPPWIPVAGGAAGGGPSRNGSYVNAPVGCNAIPGTATRLGIVSNSADAGVENRERFEPRISVALLARRAKDVPSLAVARSVAASLAVETEKTLGVAAFHSATGPPGEVSYAK
jgi:hypothetical protein